MNQAAEKNPIREHYFYAAVAKHVFEHQQHGLVFVRDPLSLNDAAQYGLKPLILYGITVAGTSITWLTFAPTEGARTFTSVLQEAWTEGTGLRGMPDVLKINRHVAAACPGLSPCLANLGIKVVVADGNDKRFSAALRSAQGKSAELDCIFGGRELPPVRNLKELLLSAKTQHEFDIQTPILPQSSKHLMEGAERWFRLPVNPLPASIPEVNWTPGPWLYAWEANLPPSSPRFFTENIPKWLILGHAEDFDAESFEETPESPLAAIKLMVASWPNTVAEIAKEIEVPTKELQWFLTSRTNLPVPKVMSLQRLLNVHCGRAGYYEATGPCVLVARAPQAIARAYEELSHGGDLVFSFEALPDKGVADPSWRYLIFQSWGDSPNVIMVPRGSRVSGRLDSDQFINFEGPKQIPASLYRDLVRTCANACISPAANLREIEGFIRRRIDDLQMFEKQY